MQMPRNVALIPGAPRSGTTSLWRHLSRHPDIAASTVKELNFFYDRRQDGKPYDACFAASGRVTLEASPVYFREHRAVVERLAQGVPRARLIFILREPAARLSASFRGERDWFHRVADQVGFLDFARIVTEGRDPTPIFPDDPAQAAYVRDGSRVGFYAEILEHYLAYFPPEQILVLFLDDLICAPRAVIERCCCHIGVDPARQPEIIAQAQNQGITVRNWKLFALARKINAGCEPLFNKAPWLRRGLRRLHHGLNASPLDRNSPDIVAGRALLEQWYRPANARLAALMARHFPEASVPDWLGPARNKEV